MSKNMVKSKGMLTAMNISSHQKRRKGQNSYTRTETELQFEIEWVKRRLGQDIHSRFSIRSPYQEE
jgi:hypothetical protein